MSCRVGAVGDRNVPKAVFPEVSDFLPGNTTVRLSLCCEPVTNTNTMCYERKSLSST